MTPAVAGFELQACLGEGAFGAVYLARETEGLKRRVALKLFHAADSQAFARELRMTQEVEAVRSGERVAELLQALGSGESAGRGWISLEYLEAGSLHDVVEREGPLSARRAAAACADAARGLAALHAAGLFHRDVKPGNLLLGSDGRVRLGDFGLSRRLSGSLSAAGSPAFAAPEVIADDLRDGRRADVYSLGATLSFLLTGAPMYPARPDVFALEARGVPPDLQRLIVAATAFDPATRPPDARAFLEALEGAALEAGPEAAQATPWRRVGAAEAAPTARDAAATSGRGAALLGLILLAALLVPLGLAWALGATAPQAVGSPAPAPEAPEQRFRVEVPGVIWLWARPALYDVDVDGVRDLVLNANGFTGGTLFARSGRDGRELWRSELCTNPWASPTLVDDPMGPRIAIGTYERGEAFLTLLHPQTGRVESSTRLGPADRAPLTVHPGLGGELLCVTDLHEAEGLPAALYAVQGGHVSWLREATELTPDAPLTHYGLRTSTVDTNADGAPDAVVWQAGAELVALHPDTGGQAWRLRPTISQPALRVRWTYDHDGTLVAGWNSPEGVELAACDQRGVERWRRRLPGVRVTEVAWLALEPDAPRALLVSVGDAEGGALLRLDAWGELVAEHRSPSKALEQAHVLRTRERRCLLVNGLYPARLELLDPTSLRLLSSQSYPGTHTHVAARLDHDRVDELIVLDRHGCEVEVRTPALPR
ncbi:MAG: serine/threonine-protein kinase [Planctomycetota bacterium]